MMITEHTLERAVTAVVVANAVVMLWGLIDRSREELLENVDLAFLWFFASELAVRLWIARLGFFRSVWNTADAIIIVVALLPVLGGGIAVLRMARLARSAHLLRHVTHLRLWRLLRVAP
jgi:voltage-gated sodium channel